MLIMKECSRWQGRVVAEKRFDKVEEEIMQQSAQKCWVACHEVVECVARIFGRKRRTILMYVYFYYTLHSARKCCEVHTWD